MEITILGSKPTNNGTSFIITASVGTTGLFDTPRTYKFFSALNPEEGEILEVDEEQFMLKCAHDFPHKLSKEELAQYGDETSAKRLAKFAQHQNWEVYDSTAEKLDIMIAAHGKQTLSAGSQLVKLDSNKYTNAIATAAPVKTLATRGSRTTIAQ